jgi:LysM repeat protein
MALKNPFKLQKLQINVYGNRLRIGEPKQTLKVMFNPASFISHHENSFSKYQGINSSGRPARFLSSRSDQIKLELVLDSTGVTDSGAASLAGRGAKSVTAQIDEFLAACAFIKGELHEPAYLKIQWGDSVLQAFDCRLQSVEIEYTGFERTGSPNHAILRTTFVEDLEPAKRLRQERKSSPDLSHSRVVKSGDTLPLLTKEIYGSSAYYLRVAQANGLDDFRDLTPGQVLIFPPLDVDR